MAERFVLDTNVVLCALAGRLADPLPEGRCDVSVIGALERLSYTVLEHGEERQVPEFLATVTVVELDDAVKSAAIHLWRRHRTKLANAIMA